MVSGVRSVPLRAFSNASVGASCSTAASSLRWERRRRVYQGTVAEAPSENVDHPLWQRDGLGPGLRLLVPPSDVGPSGREVDIFDAETDKFRPVQAGVGEEGNDVAPIPGRDGEFLELARGQLEVALRSEMRPADPPTARVAVNAAVLVSDVEH